ncbi:MAG TPA: flagellar basal body rod protein FlgB [Candidatus Acidoferrales bacterium]|nr:flagellar basal body rod protein FlgB [Candidatus Acidoferrales bacterium]
MKADFSNSLGIHETALKVWTARAQLLATNIANADTPGFAARDIDFKAVLSRAAGRFGPPALVMTDARHLPAAGAGEAVRYRVPSQPALDGNSVDLQQEQSAFAQNAVRYQATLQFIQNRLRSLQQAISGGER